MFVGEVGCVTTTHFQKRGFCSLQPAPQAILSKTGYRILVTQTDCLRDGGRRGRALDCLLWPLSPKVREPVLDRGVGNNLDTVPLHRARVHRKRRDQCRQLTLAQSFFAYLRFRNRSATKRKGKGPTLFTTHEEMSFGRDPQTKLGGWQRPGLVQ